MIDHRMAPDRPVARVKCALERAVVGNRRSSVLRAEEKKAMVFRQFDAPVEDRHLSAPRGRDDGVGADNENPLHCGFDAAGGWAGRDDFKWVKKEYHTISRAKSPGERRKASAFQRLPGGARQA